MRKLGAWLRARYLRVGAAAAAERPGKIVWETRDAARLKAGRVSFVHTVVRETPRDTENLLHATTELDLTVKRFKESIRLRMRSQADLAGIGTMASHRTTPEAATGKPPDPAQRP
jgi:hypothetical protein